MPIPSHWEPWPGKTNTVLPVSPVPVITDAPGRPSASSPNPVSNWSRSAPTTTARRSNAARPASDQPTSAAGNSSRPPMNPASRAACDSSAAVDLADTTHGTTAGGAAGLSAVASTGGAPLVVTGGLVPLIPNDHH